MKGRKADEIVRLEEGLAQAGEDWLPKAIETELEPKSPEDLLCLTNYGDRLEDAVKIRNGWIYIMLKRKVGHRHFQKYLEDHRRSYWRARDCMNYARAASRHPALAGAIAGHSIRYVLALPEPEIHKLEEAITGIPADEAKKITRDWLEREYQNIQSEKRSRAVQRKLTPKERAKEEKFKASQTERTAFDEAYDEAAATLRKGAAALKRLLEFFAPERDRPKIFDPEWNRLRELNDCVEEIQARADEFRRRAWKGG